METFSLNIHHFITTGETKRSIHSREVSSGPLVYTKVGEGGKYSRGCEPAHWGGDKPPPPHTSLTFQTGEADLTRTHCCGGVDSLAMNTVRQMNRFEPGNSKHGLDCALDRGGATTSHGLKRPPMLCSLHAHPFSCMHVQ